MVFKIRNLEMYPTEFVQIRFATHLNVRFNLGNHRYDDIKIFSQVNLNTHFCAHFHVIFFGYIFDKFEHKLIKNETKILLNGRSPLPPSPPSHFSGLGMLYGSGTP